MTVEKEGPPRLPLFNPRIATVAIHDVFMAAASFELAVWIAYYVYGLPQPFFFVWQGTMLFTAVCAVTFGAMGLYRGIWHYASLADLSTIVKAATLAILIFLPLLFVLTRLNAFPRSALLIEWPLLIILLAVPRLTYRLIKDGNLSAVFERGQSRRVPVLLVGAGDLAESFIRQMSRRREATYHVVGIVDNKVGRIGRDIRGVRVLGDIEGLPDAIQLLEREKRRPERVIIANDRLDGAVIRRLLETTETLGIKLSRMPRPTDFTSDDQAARLEVRAIDVEDLLGRPQKVLDRETIKAFIGGKRVLVTGAGGTIGSELVRQLAALGPSSLALVDNSEYALYRIDLELSETFPDLTRNAILGDVRDQERIAVILQRERPQVVFHAAAFKHVPLVEANPNEGVLTNVIGTVNLADACRSAGVSAMVMISTDKAVSPSSVMGATKRIAEMICQGQSLGEAGTHFTTVRFGNVLGSTGSVVPLFQRQLARGGPLTVTHPDVTRYFMTAREAVELVLHASAHSSEAQTKGKIHVLDMGEPVRIQDLARQMIRLAGGDFSGDVEITHTGLRPGEKLHEELFHQQESPQPTAIPGVLLASPRSIDYELLKPQLEKLSAAAQARRTDETMALIHHLVPEYEGSRGNTATASEEAASSD